MRPRSSQRLRWSTLVAALSAAVGGGVAQASDQTPDRPQYSIFNPEPESDLGKLQTDRPLLAFTPYTVAPGHYQVEGDFFIFRQSSDRTSATRTLQSLDPSVRIGVARFLELDLATAGFETDRTTSDGTGRTLSRNTGTGAAVVRARVNVFGDDGGDAAFSLIPFVTIPSGDKHFGNQRVEGGLIAPLALSLPYGFSLVLQTEVEALHNSSGDVFASVSDIAYLKHAIPGIENLSGVIEFTATNNIDRHTADTYSFEGALAYLIDRNTQIDIAGFKGLNSAAIDYRVISGLVHRF